MISTQLLEYVSPLKQLSKNVTSQHAAEEALAFDTDVILVDSEKNETAAKRTAGETGFHPQDNKVNSKEEERKQQDLRKSQRERAAQELFLLQSTFSYLLQSNRLEEAEGAVCCFIDNNPRDVNGFLLLAKVHSQRGNLAAVCECLWGAIYSSPGNRVLLRQLRDSEEQFLLQQCQLPLRFLSKCLTIPNSPEGSRIPFEDIVQSAFIAERHPVVVVRQGNYVMALTDRNLEPGDVIFRQRPFVLTPLMLGSAHIYSSCFYCLQDREDPGHGFSCPIAPYTCPFVFCSWECLMRNSRIHALECQAFPLLLAAAKESKLSPTTVLHIFRTIAKAGLERQSRQGQQNAENPDGPTADIIEQLLKLNSYRTAVEQGQPELYRQLTILARRLQRVLPPQLLLFLQESELIELMLVLWQYSPFLTAPSIPSAVQRKNPDGAVGQVLAPAVAFLHHSCVPTCVLTLQEDGMIAVRALTFIPAGGSLCLSLEDDLFRPQKDRKGVTAPPRVFGCGCIRCRDSTEGGRRLRGIRCFKCVRGFLCPRKSNPLTSRLHFYSASLATSLDPSGSDQAVGKNNEYSAAAEKLRLQRKNLPKLPEGLNNEGPLAGTLPQEDDWALYEEWICSCCGLTSAAVSRNCMLLERAVERQQDLAEKAFVSGARVKACKEYKLLVQQFSSQLHPQHAILFNSHTVLAGLLASQRKKDPQEALIYIRRAALAAETVLPPSSRLKMDLYLKLAELTFETTQLDQYCRRGPSLPSEFIMGPMYLALWNCCVCFGNESSLAIVLQQRLRRYAALLHVCTPPLLLRPVFRMVDIFVDLYRQVIGARTESDEDIAEQLTQDPMFLAVALLRRGSHCPLTLELFMAMKNVPHLPTGLTLLGLACIHKQVHLVRELLKMGFDMFHTTALGMTALLAMCAGMKPQSDLPQEFGYKNLHAAEEKNTLEDSSKREAAILRLLLQRCCELDSQDPTTFKVLPGQGQSSREGKKPLERRKGILKVKPVFSAAGGTQVRSHRNRLLTACTHKLLGRSSALHLAASTGKSRMCWQLLSAGTLVGALNAEGATALHLACVAGDLATVKVLLDRGAPVDATTLRGETPLLMAAYNLHSDVCTLLLQCGADSAVTTRAEGLTVLHAVAAGVTRQVTMHFCGLSWEGDRVEIALSGLSEESAKLGIYTRANAYIAQEAMVDLSFPCASPENSEIFMFPTTMLKRTDNAQKTLLVLMKHCNGRLYTQQSRRGLSPADLLLQMWEAFIGKRGRILQIGDLQLEGQTREERKYMEERWEFVLHKILIVREMLMPNLASLCRPSTMSEYLDTPREDELQKRNKDDLVTQAPWLFPELVQHSIKSSKSNPLRNTPPAPPGSDADPPGFPGGQARGDVVGTGN